MEDIQHYDLAIIGAGASGLMCAHHIMKHHNYENKMQSSENQQARKSPPSIVILEARNRIGGRIDSEAISVRNVVTGDSMQLVRDNGAAWVHGIGSDWIYDANNNKNNMEKFPRKRINTKNTNAKEGDSLIEEEEENPMMSLLQQVVPPGEEVQSLLNPIFPQGNPWMRPQHVLHRGNNIALYVAGTHLDPEKDANIIQTSLDRHFQTMKDVSRIGNTMFDSSGDGLSTVLTSLQQTINKLGKEKSRTTTACTENEDYSATEIEEAMINALTPFYLHLIENWSAAATSQLQLSEFIRDDDDDNDCARMDEKYCSEGDFYGPHCTVQSGMETMLDPLLTHGVSECIKLEQEVQNVSLLHSQNKVDDNKHAKVLLQCKTGLKVSADVCVVTLPLGCLQKSISNNEEPFFQPPLSDKKQEAILAHRMGIYKKVFLIFDRIFWPKDESMIGMIRRLEHDNSDIDDGDDKSFSKKNLGNHLLFYNCWAKHGLPCIETVLCANEWAVNRSDEDIRDAVLDFMQDSMGQNLDVQEWFVDCHVTRWEEDKFSGWGAYSSYCLGTLERHTDELKSPEWNSKLLFCGEATISEHEGSVHAALMSGVRAARECIADE
eukprot:CAMPEP_0195307752 /NCGR_PEP_ID=MMETSP0707-20130614/37876_1 /TAXON_ID=33640 /ORGANISM="Asterionellopsis glacialis, Strain CCMP134" /LENGTH=605 /DNA_ID=CAMNT_0040372005 /DNA_START=9 /DNA_END=1826 /DNA_ORIENTATION=-